MRGINNPSYLRVPSARLFGVAAVVAGLFLGCGAQSKSPKAPDFTLTDLDGHKFSLSEFKGKVVFIDFWATWCPPCVMSTPDVERFHNEYKDKGVEFIGISLDDSPDAARSFVSSHGLTYRVAMSDRDIESRYGVSGIPAFYIIDQNGFITKSWGGYNPSLTFLWRREVDKLLKA